MSDAQLVTRRTYKHEGKEAYQGKLLEARQNRLQGRVQFW